MRTQTTKAARQPPIVTNLISILEQEVDLQVLIRVAKWARAEKSDKWPALYRKACFLILDEPPQAQSILMQMLWGEER